MLPLGEPQRREAPRNRSAERRPLRIGDTFHPDGACARGVDALDDRRLLVGGQRPERRRAGASDHQLRQALVQALDESEGQGGVAGFGKGSAKVELVDDNGATILRYTAAAQVGGKIAQLGQRLIDGVAKSLSEEFFKRFDLETEKIYPPQAAIAATAPAAESEDTESKGWPNWVWFVAAAVVLGLIYAAR